MPTASPQHLRLGCWRSTSGLKNPGGVRPKHDLIAMVYTHQGAERSLSLQPQPRHGRIKLATPLAGAAREGRAGTAPSARPRRRRPRPHPGSPEAAAPPSPRPVPHREAAGAPLRPSASSRGRKKGPRRGRLPAAPGAATDL